MVPTDIYMMIKIKISLIIVIKGTNFKRTTHLFDPYPLCYEFLRGKNSPNGPKLKNRQNLRQYRFMVPTNVHIITKIQILLILGVQGTNIVIKSTFFCHTHAPTSSKPIPKTIQQLRTIHLNIGLWCPSVAPYGTTNVQITTKIHIYLIIVTKGTNNKRTRMVDYPYPLSYNGSSGKNDKNHPTLKKAKK